MFAATAANICSGRCEHFPRPLRTAKSLSLSHGATVSLPRSYGLSPTELRPFSHGATASLPRSYGLQHNCAVAHNEYLSFGSKNIERRDYQILGYAFSEFTIKGGTIPALIGSIGNRAFGSCESLTAIRIPDGKKTLKINTGYYGTFAYSGAEKTVYAGRNIERNANEATFSNVTGVEFGPSMTNIATYLLAGSTALANVKARWQQPFGIDDNVFADVVYQTATLWIPNGTLQAYKAANGWKNFIKVDYAYFNVSLQANKGGTVTAGELKAGNSTVGTLFDCGSNVQVVITEYEGYELKSLTVNGTAVQPANGVYTIQNLQADQTVVATFGPIEYTISYDLAGGSLPQGKTNPATYNVETATFTLVSPERQCYEFTGWTCTGLNEPAKTVCQSY